MNGEKKVIYIHKRVHYLTIKNNEIVLFAGKWMELEFIMFNTISQTEKDLIFYFLPLLLFSSVTLILFLKINLISQIFVIF
jgi:hypothetical protein